MHVPVVVKVRVCIGASYGRAREKLMGQAQIRSQTAHKLRRASCVRAKIFVSQGAIHRRTPKLSPTHIYLFSGKEHTHNSLSKLWHVEPTVKSRERMSELDTLLIETRGYI